MSDNPLREGQEKRMALLKEVESEFRAARILMIEALRRRSELRRQCGLCRDCGAPSAPYSRCFDHRRKDADRSAARRAESPTAN